MPFYNLRKLHFALKPFYEKRGIKARTYSWILWNWFVLNRPPHTDWDKSPEQSSPPKERDRSRRRLSSACDGDSRVPSPARVWHAGARLRFSGDRSARCYQPQMS